MSLLHFTYRRVDALKERAKNPRTHTKKQIEEISRSIQRFGFNNPLLLDANDNVVAGNGRLAAAKLLKMEEVPTILLADISPEDLRLYAIADNRLAEKAGWDRALLGQELRYLSELQIELDLSITGFELPEIDIILNEADQATEEVSVSVEPPTITRPTTPVTRPGDIWNIGDHRLICGDATAEATYVALLGGRKAQLVFADPPYNVRINGHVGGAGAIVHPEFAMASGEMSRNEFVNFLGSVFRLLTANTIPGSIHFQCMDWRHTGEMLEAGEGAYSELKNICVWTKSNGGMGSLYRSQHELVFVFKSGSAKHINNVELGKHGRNRTNVWAYAGVNTWGPGRADLQLHPTVKPMALVADAILDCSHRGNIVLDPFAGSGTTLAAAQKTGRKGFGIEIDPAYCDVIIQRLLDLYRMTATLEETGQTFDEAKRMRRPAARPETSSRGMEAA